jgi:nucleoside-diphosphate-sugar epimerase
MSPTRELNVLFLGGTGIISGASVRLAAQRGMQVFVLNRGVDLRHRGLPDGVVQLHADVRDEAALVAALPTDVVFDCVVDVLSFTSDDAARAVRVFSDRTRQYIQISSASAYRKPVLQWPIVESSLLSNPYCQYARDKIAAEVAIMDAYRSQGFPATVVRPSHTYDEAQPPIPGDWTTIDRIARGDEIVVPGDGTSLWTLTHAEDFAVGLVGLVGNPRAVGEAFHITSDDVYTWDQIYDIVAGALGVEAKLVHIPAEHILTAAPDWFWSELLIGDLAHSAVFDNSKITRYVPAFAPTRTFHLAAHDIARWRAEHASEAAPAHEVDEVQSRLVSGYHQAAEVFSRLAPAAAR